MKSKKLNDNGHLLSSDDLREKIHAANVELHRFEAKYYTLVHPEVYNPYEQKRIISTLKMIDNLMADVTPVKKALDFGAGTGNLTGKLLKMGYVVTAVDISAEMCSLLETTYKSYVNSKQLTVISSPIEDVNFDEGEFDLITCYSVLHHLPDYLGAIQKLSVFLKQGGVLYLDHEASPSYWNNEPRLLPHLLKHLYFHSNPILNTLYFQLVGISVPSLDYTMSDYWHKKDHHIDHEQIEHLFEKENFDSFTRKDYHLKGTWFPNPIFYLYKSMCKPEMSSWIAKK
ncbi:MAG: class I SAM-dependent methyltransferase [Candidatus Bathyarchaeota archaeon]|nr:class I SAM-dependent methyltransferase [Candidatus Bathyarchaeum sp.]